jgi:hypothetical protein
MSQYLHGTDFGQNNSGTFQGLFVSITGSHTRTHTHKNDVTAGWSIVSFYLAVQYLVQGISIECNIQHPNTILKNTQKTLGTKPSQSEELGARESPPDWDSCNYFR